MTSAVRERLIKFSNGVLIEKNWVVDKYIYLNHEKTRRLIIGKTLVEGKPMLYVIAQIQNGFSWYTDQMFFARNAEKVVETIQKMWQWLR